MPRAIFTALLALLALAGPARAEEGTLVIVGGGLEPGNAAVHKAFLNRLGRTANIRRQLRRGAGQPRREGQ